MRSFERGWNLNKRKLVPESVNSPPSDIRAFLPIANRKANNPLELFEATKIVPKLRLLGKRLIETERIDPSFYFSIEIAFELFSKGRIKFAEIKTRRNELKTIICSP